MERIKIGFVGVGGMGQCAHLRNYATLPECQVVAIAEVREGLGREVAKRYGVPRTYRSHTELLENEELDGIVASQPFTRHGTLVPDLLQAGVPLFTEKPLAGSLEQGERILEALARSGTWHMVGYHKRSDPATMHARKVMNGLNSTGELGKLRYVRILMPAGDWVANGFTGLISSDEPMPPLESDPPASDMDSETYEAYLGFVNYYIHQVNLLRHLLGEPYRVTYADPSGVLLAAQSETGICGTIEMTPYRTTVDWEESALIAYERGYLLLELPAPLASFRAGRLTIYRDPGDGAAPTRTQPVLPWVHAMLQQAANFIAAIRGESAPPCEAAEAMEDLVVAREYIRLLRGV